ncbi:MAG: hypothetical protein ACTHNM_06815 [Dyella sp.]|uniref:hypothetical protein n=1 Tax=Dyella sp. TaxID=1869338 RepID=UPI003F81A378
MSREPINFSNLNLGGSVDIGSGVFTTQMLAAALGLPSEESVGIGVGVGAIAAPDYLPGANPGEWLWKPDTVQPYMTAAAAATVRAAVTAAYEAKNPGRAA